MELFVEHRVQGDVLFNLTEENLKEMGVDKELIKSMGRIIVQPFSCLREADILGLCRYMIAGGFGIHFCIVSDQTTNNCETGRLESSNLNSRK